MLKNEDDLLNGKLTDDELEEGSARLYLKKLQEKLAGKQYFIIFGLTGLFFIGFGLFITREDFFNSQKVEIVSGDVLGEENKNIFIEIAGAVENPGVYEVAQGSRVDALFIIAGGLSSKADRKWVEKNINKASVVKDGQKIYIPKIDESLNDISINYGSTQSPTTIGELLNINTATLSQLDRLDGIGMVRAQKIIDNKPYATIDELLSKKILPKNIFEGIKDKITAQ